jgi:hypothetical protein
VTHTVTEVVADVVGDPPVVVEAVEDGVEVPWCEGDAVAVAVALTVVDDVDVAEDALFDAVARIEALSVAVPQFETEPEVLKDGKTETVALPEEETVPEPGVGTLYVAVAVMHAVVEGLTVVETLAETVSDVLRLYGLLITVVVDVGDAADTLAAAEVVATGLTEGMTEAVKLADTEGVADAVVVAAKETVTFPVVVTEAVALPVDETFVLAVTDAVADGVAVWQVVAVEENVVKFCEAVTEEVGEELMDVMLDGETVGVDERETVAVDETVVELDAHPVIDPVDDVVLVEDCVEEPDGVDDVDEVGVWETEEVAVPARLDAVTVTVAEPVIADAELVDVAAGVPEEAVDADPTAVVLTVTVTVEDALGEEVWLAVPVAMELDAEAVGKEDPVAPADDETPIVNETVTVEDGDTEPSEEEVPEEELVGEAVTVFDVHPV